MARRGEKPQKAAMNIIKRNRGGSKSQKGKTHTGSSFFDKVLAMDIGNPSPPDGWWVWAVVGTGVISRGLSMRRSGRRWLFHVDHMVITAPCIVLRRAVVVTSAKLLCLFIACL